MTGLERVARRETIEAEADAVRARLAATIDEIDRRAHDAVNVKLQLRRHAVPLVIAGVVVLSVIVAVVAARR